MCVRMCVRMCAYVYGYGNILIARVCEYRPRIIDTFRRVLQRLRLSSAAAADLLYYIL